MLIYIFGEETYITHRKVEEIKHAYREQNSSANNYIFFDCEEKCNVYDICDTMSAQDLFAQEKMIIVKNFIQTTKVDEQKIMQKALKNPSDRIVFWEYGMPRKNASMVTWLTQHADEIFEGKKLQGKDLITWINAYVQAQDATIKTDAIHALILYVGNDLWRLSQEIDKLAAYATGRAIISDDVHLLVHGNIDADMFATVEALVSHDKKYALTVLKKQLAKGDDPYHIFGMYAYQIRTLLLIGDAAQWGKISERGVIAKTAGVHPFVVQKSLPLIRNFSQRSLIRAHRLLTRFDRDIKTGKRDIHSALDLFVVSI